MGQGTPPRRPQVGPQAVERAQIAEVRAALTSGGPFDLVYVHPSIVADVSDLLDDLPGTVDVVVSGDYPEWLGNAPAGCLFSYVRPENDATSEVADQIPPGDPASPDAEAEGGHEGALT